MFKSTLQELYGDPDKVVITAHRGFSGQYPENTFLAFEKALDLGVDLIEFDLWGSKDGVPVVLHDRALDRTSDGTGPTTDYTLAQLKQFNLSYWQPTFGGGYKLDEPAYPDVRIPTFADLLDFCGRRVGLNIQVKEADDALLAEICRLYDEYDLYEQGYLSMSSWADSERVRAINRRIEICTLADQNRMTPQMLQQHKDFGNHYVQPGRDDVTPGFCEMARRLGLGLNMFYSNSDPDARRYIGYGLRGFLTDHPDVLLRTVADLGLH
jgi:glycerophosphoryl diester phosphodiesterase